MTARRANAVFAVVWGVMTVASVILWADAWIAGFIGDTAFIGHVSMAALVISCAALTWGAIAAWRADVPTE